VSAAGGAALIPHLPAGQGRLTMLLGCYAMFGVSLFASVIVITLVWSRLITDKTMPAETIPAMWIVLGPLGQSVTAAGSLAGVTALALPRPYPSGAAVFALLYGLPAWGFAMLWLCLASAVTARTVRHGMPFGLTWWAFTFPVGTCVTGTISLAGQTRSVALHWASIGLFVLLAGAWLVVATRTAAGTWRGQLFQPAGQG
jgi:tellurite resistance protein TehA-like permease